MDKTPWRRVTLKEAAEIAAVVACVVAILALANDLRSDHSTASTPDTSSPPDSQDLPRQPAFRLTSPVDGSEAGADVYVEAVSPYSELNNYFVILDPRGGRRIQDGPLVVSSRGLLGARVKLGSAAVGLGEEYGLAAIATRATPSPDSDVPPDAIYSNIVRVRRGLTPPQPGY